MKMPDPFSAVSKKVNQILEFSMEETKLKPLLHPDINLMYLHPKNGVVQAC